MNTAYIEKIFSLDGRKAVVTGASSGIGRAIAISLANFGAEVALLGRSADGLRTTHETIAANGGIGCRAKNDTITRNHFFGASP